MFYIIYKITNQINGKFYIGSHKTKDLNDNYMGSGKYLVAAQKKYGVENFQKEILFVFSTAAEMYAKEAEIVNADFLVTENTYNLKIGGFGGWDYLNDKDKFQNPTHTKEHLTSMSRRVPRHKKVHALDIGREKIKQIIKENNGKQPWTSKGFKNKKHSETTKRQIGQKNSIAQKGSKNSQFGTRWIYNDTLQQSKKIKKNDPLPDGWTVGRKLNKRNAAPRRPGL